MYYQIYIDQSREWRWRYVSSNGRTIAVSSESYVNKSDCIRSVDIMKASWNSPVYS